MNDVVVFKDGELSLEVKVSSMEETVWLTQQQMAELFNSSRTNIVEHINHIYVDGELSKESTCQDFRQVRKEGNREVSRESFCII